MPKQKKSNFHCCYGDRSGARRVTLERSRAASSRFCSSSAVTAVFSKRSCSSSLVLPFLDFGGFCQGKLPNYQGKSSAPAEPAKCQNPWKRHRKHQTNQGYSLFKIGQGEILEKQERKEDKGVEAGRNCPSAPSARMQFQFSLPAPYSQSTGKERRGTFMGRP